MAISAGFAVESQEHFNEFQASKSKGRMMFTPYRSLKSSAKIFETFDCATQRVGLLGEIEQCGGSRYTANWPANHAASMIARHRARLEFLNSESATRRKTVSQQAILLTVQGSAACQGS